MDAALIDEEWLEAALASKMQETVSLDFKSGLVFENGKLSKDGRKTLAEAMSALSNSNGGTLVLGVDARPGKGDRVDCVQALVPIENLPLATSSMSQAVGDLLQPKHDGVTVRSVPCASDAAKGYLVLEVPRSGRRPHMSQPHHQYFRRSGTSNYEMEHYDIEDMFKAVTAPDLTLSFEIALGFSGMNREGPFRNFEVLIQIYNAGNVTAKDVNLVLEPIPGRPFASLRLLDGQPVSTRVRGRPFIWLPDNVVHPGQEGTIAKVPLTAQRYRAEDDVVRLLGLPSDQKELSFRWTIGAENLKLAPMQDFSISLAHLVDDLAP